IEDAIHKEIASENEVLASLIQLRTLTDPTNPASAIKPPDAQFTRFRIGVTNKLVTKAAEAFAKNAEQICTGEFGTSLLHSHGEAKEWLETLKAFARERIFVSSEAINVELSGFRILIELFDAFKPLLQLRTPDFKRLLPDAKDSLGYGELALEKRLASLV